MKGNISNKYLFSIVLILSIFTIQAHGQDQVADIINNAVSAGGGMATWENNGYLVVHETQTRYEDEGTVKVNLTHYMSTTNDGYRIELARPGINNVYGWDGNEFWATADGKQSDHDLVREATRVISNAYYRFSLPFILHSDIHDFEYAGSDMVKGEKIESVKITYSEDPAERYFSSNKEHGEHDSAGHSEHQSASTEAEHSSGSGSDHHSGEGYNFHFDEQNQLAKVHFSHHGDGTYETLLFEDLKMVDGILREHRRKLIRPDGNIHYESTFTSIDFVNEIEETSFSKP